MFAIRNTKPEAGNKFYNNGNNGGSSWCVNGNPTDKGCNVLANCVGYACGRFNEIIGSMKYKTLCSNAENFIERAQAAGLEIGSTPKPGAIMCWAKGSLNGNDGAGHVAVVERVNADGSVYTSESSWAGAAFFNATRSNANGRWGMASGYTFRGFIYNPAVKEEPKPEPGPVGKFKVGDIVYIEGNLYQSSNSTEPAGFCDGKTTEITRVNPGSAHPYNTTGDLGWMDESSISPGKIEPAKPVSKEIELGDTVIVNGYGNANSFGNGINTRVFTNHKMKVIGISDKKERPNRYALNQYNRGTVGNWNEVTGWFREQDITKE